MNAIKAIETRYAGCHFRSRLEARWAVFFDTLGIPWEYEPQGFETPAGWYLPDFLLTDCSTWVEVRGNNERVDLDALALAAEGLPDMPLGTVTYTRDDKTTSWSAEQGPKLMLLGPIPRADHCVISDALGDLAWLGWDGETWSRWGFGVYHKNRRPWWSGRYSSDPLEPAIDCDEPGCRNAYNAARSARFEHGESGAT